MTIDLAIWHLPLLTYTRSPFASFTQIWLQLDLNKNQQFQSNLTSDYHWPWHLTSLIYWETPIVSLAKVLVVTGLQLFKGDLNNKNLTKLESTYNWYTYTSTHIYTEGICYSNIPYCFSSHGIKTAMSNLFINRTGRNRKNKQTKNTHNAIGRAYLFWCILHIKVRNRLNHLIYQITIPNVFSMFRSKNHFVHVACLFFFTCFFVFLFHFDF